VRDRQKAPVASANDYEGAVVAGEAERAADGWVDEPAGAARDVHRERHDLEQTAGNADAVAGARVQGGELGVIPKAAGKQVDRAELAQELAARTRKGCRIGDA
jgi:Ribonuclease G/E